MLTRRTAIQAAVAALIAPASARAMFPRGGSAVNSSSADPIDGYYAAGTFTSDPFSSYNSYILNPSFGGTDGASSTISWNGGSLTAPTYKEVQTAINAAAGAGNRLCIPAGTTISVPASTVYTFPTGGLSNSARFVVQGDPAASSSTMPIFDFGNNGGYINPCLSNNTKWLTFRKLSFQNNTASMLTFAPNTQEAIDGTIVEFCYFYNLVAPSGATDNGCIDHGPGIMWAQSALPSYRYNYFDYATVTGYDPATQRENTAGITFVCSGTAGAYGFYIHHNEFYECGQGVYNKVAPYNSTSQPNGGIYAYNIFHSCALGVYNGGAGASENPYIDDQVFNNLFYAIGLTAYAQDSSDADTPQCSGHTVYNNTFAEDCNQAVSIAETMGFIFFNNLRLASTGEHVVLAGDASGSYINTIALCDWNAYGVPGSLTIFETNHYVTPNYTFTAVTGADGWDSAYSTYMPAQLSANPDTHSFNAIQGRAITTSDVNSYTTRDYSPIAGSALLTTGRGGSYAPYMGCYNADSIPDSNLVGRGWS